MRENRVKAMGHSTTCSQTTVVPRAKAFLMILQTAMFLKHRPRRGLKGKVP
jgi:hypothetical protein